MIKNIIIIALGIGLIFFAATDSEYEQRIEDFADQAVEDLNGES